MPHILHVEDLLVPLPEMQLHHCQDGMPWLLGSGTLGRVRRSTPRQCLPCVLRSNLPA